MSIYERELPLTQRLDEGRVVFRQKRNFPHQKFGREYNEDHGLHQDDRSMQHLGERGGHYGKGPKGWKRSDEGIKEDVSLALYLDPSIDASNIEVSVKDHTVYLDGTVDGRASKRAAENCVERVLGVEDVQNRLRLSSLSANYQ